MKKQILLFSALAFSVVAMAQSKIGFGVRAGVTQASMKGDAVNSLQNLLNFTGGAVSTANKTGVFGGATVSIPLSQQFSIEPGLLYAQKGYEIRGNFGIKGTDIVGAKSQLNLSYIDLPVVAKANFNGFQVFAGPQISYLAGASLNTTAGVFGFNFINDKRDVKNQFNEVDFALTGGLGYQFKNGVNLTAAYDHGLSKVNSGQSVEAYNRTLKVGIGLRF